MQSPHDWKYLGFYNLSVYFPFLEIKEEIHINRNFQTSP